MISRIPAEDMPMPHQLLGLTIDKYLSQISEITSPKVFWEKFISKCLVYYLERANKRGDKIFHPVYLQMLKYQQLHIN